MEEIQASCTEQLAGVAAGRRGLAIHYRIGRVTAVDSYHHKLANENYKGERHVKAEFMIDADIEKRRNNLLRNWYSEIQGP